MVQQIVLHCCKDLGLELASQMGPVEFVLVLCFSSHTVKDTKVQVSWKLCIVHAVVLMYQPRSTEKGCPVSCLINAGMDSNMCL